MKAILKTEHLSKNFGATKAVIDVDFELFPGEVRGLVGENGSGKSTFSNMITGAIPVNSGEIYLRGERYIPKSIHESRQNGIALLAQELGTIDGLTVAENIFIGVETVDPKKKIVNTARLNQETARILKENGFEYIQPDDFVDSYSFEDRKMIEVARAMQSNPDVLIVDETTTALSEKGRAKIYEIIQLMKQKNKCVIFISHDLDEIVQVCDNVTVLRDGVLIDTLRDDQLTKDNIREKMIGRDFEGSFYRADKKCSYKDDVVLDVQNICYKNIVQGVSFQLHAGEILGLGGLTECGKHELCKIIFGNIKPDKGTVTVTHDNVQITSSHVAMKHKVGYLPKDRDLESLFISSSIKDNIIAGSLPLLEKGFLIPPSGERRMANEQTKTLSVKMSDINQSVSELSGGNKQKVAISKWLANKSEILIVDCPTRGIDIGVKVNIYRLMEQLKAEGKAILMVSEELMELIGMSDRILIMRDGKISGEVLRDEEPTEATFIKMMI